MLQYIPNIGDKYNKSDNTDFKYVFKKKIELD